MTLSIRPWPFTARGTRGDERGARHAADERVRGARRQPGPPGREVPGDRADETGEHDRRRDRAGVDDAAGDRRGDLQGDERADEVQDRGHGTAARGDIARVDTVVAIAFAVSWKPLVKSNASAVTTTMARMRSPSTARATRS